jgi:hypothetical protein
MITKLPKSMWLMNAAVTASLVIGLLGLFWEWALKIEAVMKIVISLLFLCWLVAGASWLFNMYRQSKGAYRNLQPKHLRDQDW